MRWHLNSTTRYKLIFYYGAFHRPKDEFLNYYWGKIYGEFAEQLTPPAWEFYDLKKDPHEMVNRYDDPAYAEIIKELKEELKRTRIELNETDQNHPELQEIIEKNWE